jgi:Protein of unknown function, DUF547
MKFQISDFRFQIGVALAAFALAVASATAQDNTTKPLDETLDLYVRDGFVYYRALRSDRSRLDRYVNAIASADVAGRPRDEQIAFWINAYNAIALKTVVDQYPIPVRSKEYPARSIRQVPGAFERNTHRVGGKSVTLDQIEQTILAEFGDPRVFFALGRGAVGSGRLHSEAYSAAALDRQLTEVANECATRAQCVDINKSANEVRVSSIFSWRQKEFSAAYADKADKLFASRSPVERAVLALVSPRLLTTEREFLEPNQFKVVYIPFDWSLNDLTGRGGR